MTRPRGRAPSVPRVFQISSVGSGALRTSIQSRIIPGAASLSTTFVSGSPSLTGGKERPTTSIQPNPSSRASASIVPTPRTASVGSLARTGRRRSRRRPRLVGLALASPGWGPTTGAQGAAPSALGASEPAVPVA